MQFGHSSLTNWVAELSRARAGSRWFEDSSEDHRGNGRNENGCLGDASPKPERRVLDRVSGRRLSHAAVHLFTRGNRAGLVLVRQRGFARGCTAFVQGCRALNSNGSRSQSVQRRWSLRADGVTGTTASARRSMSPGRADHHLVKQSPLVRRAMFLKLGHQTECYSNRVLLEHSVTKHDLRNTDANVRACRAEAIGTTSRCRCEPRQRELRGLVTRYPH